ncbi:hypothetical protein BDV96DRAFT_566708 [Lophiotrema nucula]|uniref:Uncharacterized protein n=1 Tax=Lophiotrema nucula TaxID=690887 RepID=A0A6A5ZPE4_9PLEO|nr:hypothetical protein BDV96DRAFT_566708 [Lophiotrema nucula]
MFSKTRRKPHGPGERAQWPDRAFILSQLWDDPEDASPVPPTAREADVDVHITALFEESLSHTIIRLNSLADDTRSDPNSSIANENLLQAPLDFNKPSEYRMNLEPLLKLREKVAKELPVSPPQRPAKGLSARPSCPPIPLDKPRPHPPKDIVDVLRMMPKREGDEESYADVKNVLDLWNRLLNVSRLTPRELTTGQERVMDLLIKRLKILEELGIGDIEEGTMVRLFQLRQNNEAVLKVVYEMHPKMKEVLKGEAYDVLAVLEVGYSYFQPLVTRHMKGKLRDVLEKEARIRLDRKYYRKVEYVGRELASARQAKDGENVGRLREEEKRVETVIKKATRKAVAAQTKWATFYLVDKFKAELQDMASAHALLRGQLAKEREPDESDRLPQPYFRGRRQSKWIVPFEPEPTQRPEIPGLIKEREEAEKNLRKIFSPSFDTAEMEQEYLELGGLPSLFQLSKRLVARATWLSARDRKDLGPREREIESRRRLEADPVATHKLFMLGVESKELCKKAASLKPGLDKLGVALQQLYDATRRRYFADSELFEALGGHGPNKREMDLEEKLASEEDDGSNESEKHEDVDWDMWRERLCFVETLESCRLARDMEWWASRSADSEE